MTGLEMYGLLLAAGVFGVTVALVGGHWSELRGRAAGDSAEETSHYSGQASRRRLMSAVLVVLAVLILAGSMVRHEVGRRPNPLFILIWLTVCGLVALLLVLAAVDWWLLQRFGRRMRSELVRRGVESLKAGLHDHENPRGHQPTNGRVDEVD